MRHGYTNQTERRGGAAYKTYKGPDALARCAAELRALTRLYDVMQVPSVISCGPTVLSTAYVAGKHGQDLLDAAHADDVLTACGELLRRLHALDPKILDTGISEGVIRHGDFGPNNILLDPATMAATALLDWEFSGIGPAIEDIAWCEWIVRMHHRDAVRSLPAFFDGYGSMPPWDERKAAMLSRCTRLEAFCHRWEPGGPGVQQWRSRTAETARWSP